MWLVYSSVKCPVIRDTVMDTVELSENCVAFQRPRWRFIEIFLSLLFHAIFFNFQFFLSTSLLLRLSLESTVEERLSV